MSSYRQSPFTLRPWPTEDKRPKNIGEFIPRVTVERDGFRHVKEAELREEIAARDEAGTDHSSPEVDSETQDDETETEEDKLKCLKTAKNDFLLNLDFAHQSALTCLDSVSLLLSKEIPSKVQDSISPDLRDKVPMETLGSTKMRETNITADRVKKEVAVATGWRLLGIDKMAQSVMAAADRLEKELGFQTKYWADVLAVRESGWYISSMPGRRQTLGVRFGFSESCGRFRQQSVGALRRRPDGTAYLDHPVVRDSQRIQVVVYRNGLVTGRSELPAPTAEDAPLPLRILEARNTIRDQELWYEIKREARSLLSFGVQAGSSVVSHSLDASTTIVITLAEVGGSQPLGEVTSDDDNRLAMGIRLALHAQLFLVHRREYNKRTVAGPPYSTATNLPYPIIRPLIARSQADTAFRDFTYFLARLTGNLQEAGISTASYSKTLSQINSKALQRSSPKDRRPTRSEVLIHAMVNNADCLVDLSIMPGARIMIRGKGFSAPIGTKWLIHTSAPSSVKGAVTPWREQDKGPNVLERLYPPAHEQYPTLDDVVYYLRQATTHALVYKFAEMTRQRLGREDIEAVHTTRGFVMIDAKQHEARIKVSTVGPLVLHLEVHWVASGEARSLRWAWGNGRSERNGRKLEDLVLGFYSGENLDGLEP